MHPQNHQTILTIVKPYPSTNDSQRLQPIPSTINPSLVFSPISSILKSSATSSSSSPYDRHIKPTSAYSMHGHHHHTIRHFKPILAYSIHPQHPQAILSRVNLSQASWNYPSHHLQNPETIPNIQKPYPALSSHPHPQTSPGILKPIQNP